MKKILFVDDEQFVLDGLKRLLWEYRKVWKLSFALNGKEALEIVNNEDIALIISDVRMPGMSGLELLEKLQSDEDTKKIPVVILTGDQDRTLKRQALDIGAVDLLNKPINKEDLVSRINNVLKLNEYNEALEKQLVESQKMELVGVMAAGAVHDLSNLLSIIIGYSNLFIDDNFLDKEDAVSMKKIRQAGEKASDLVSQILKFSRCDEGLSTINMGNLNDEILSILEITVPRGIKIKWNRPNEDIFLKGNSIKFQQVLMNLYINAVQAMGEVGRLKISMCKLQQEGRPSIRIDIEDNGPGMDKKTLENIFDPLFTTKETEQGTGLGLFVVKHIIDEYRGSIEVESKIGKGTVFRVYFPLE